MFSGLRFDAASVTSAEMSSAWAAALPRMVLRRGAMAQPAPFRRYSDSGAIFVSFHSPEIL